MWFFVVFSVILIMANESQSQNADVINLYLDRGNPVDMEVGQGNQVYCKLVDPNEHIVLDGFGRCRLTLDRVGSEHEGLWKMYVGYSGRVAVVEEIISVTVTEPESTTVKPEVIKTNPGVKMTCLLPISYKARGCQFSGPKGQVLLASGSYEETSNGTRYISELEGSVCSVIIVDPKETDLGRWRCAMDAEDGTYYAFMQVLVALEDDHYVNVGILDPTIEPHDAKSITGLENEHVTLLCSINAEIKYCDFRDTNGTIYPVFPGMKSSSVEYVGSGFNAGECGIKMILPASDNEHWWSCNIGLVENTREYTASFRVHVQEYLQVAQYEINYRSIAVSGTTYREDAPEYCRFVRSDGLTFTTENTPQNYHGYIAGRTCEIITRNPTSLDRQPWTIFAKLRHVNWEVNRQTSGLFSNEVVNRSSRPVFLYLILGVVLLSLVVSAALTPKKNREWVSNRAAAVRQSLRLRKTPLEGKEPKLPAPATAPAHPPPYAQLA